jgi:hypothetical protein
VKVESSQQLLEMRDFFALVHRDGCEERGVSETYGFAVKRPPADESLYGSME